MEKKIKVLIIDDEILIHNLYRRIWKNASIDSAFNGEEGLDKLKHNQYEVILCDYNMPKINGLELLKTNRPEESLVISNSANDSNNKLLAPYCDLSWNKKKTLPEILSFLEIVEKLAQEKTKNS